MTTTEKATPKQEAVAAKTPQEYWQGYPEAPASDNFKWIDKHGFEHQTTLRAWGPTELKHAFDNFTAAILADGAKVEREPKPIPQAEHTIQVTDETGVPVVDAQTGKPVTVALPNDTHVLTIKGVFHDQTKTGKDVLKVVVVEPYPFNGGKYGISCFNPPSEFTGWKSWPIGNTTIYAAPPNASKVIVRDPENGGKYANILEFRPA